VKKTSRCFGFALAGLVLALSALAQQQPPQPPQPPQPETQTVVINFFVMTTPDSINQLISIVDNQLRQGAKKIVILISSIGGETTSAFTAYNYLRGIPAEVTTFNIGNVDSAATVLYCAGKNRYSLPGTRFLIHSVSVQAPTNSQLDATALQTQLALVQKPESNDFAGHVNGDQQETI